MDYGHVISQAFRITWKYKFLWIFGLFLGGFGANFNFGTGNFQSSPESSRVFRATALWAAANIGIIIAAGLLFLFIGLIFFVLSIIAQAAVVGAADQAETSQIPTFGTSLQVGLTYFWRVLGLLLLVFLMVMAVLLILLIPLGILIYLVVSNQSPAIILLIVLFAFLFFIIFIPFAIVIGLVQHYALRYLVLSEKKVGEAIGMGWKLVRTHLGTTLLLWLLSAALGIAAGIGLVIIGLIIGLPVILLFVFLFSLGFSIAKLAMAFVAGLVLLLLFVFLGGIIQVYFSCYWTLAWRQLAGETAGPSKEAVTDI